MGADVEISTERRTKRRMREMARRGSRIIRRGRKDREQMGTSLGRRDGRTLRTLP